MTTHWLWGGAVNFLFSYIYTWGQNGWEQQRLSLLEGVNPQCDPSPHSGGCKGITLQKDFFAYVNKDNEAYVVRRDMKNRTKWLAPQKLVNNTYFIRGNHKGDDVCLVRGEGSAVNFSPCDELSATKQELAWNKFADNDSRFKLQISGVGYFHLTQDNKVVIEGSEALSTMWQYDSDKKTLKMFDSDRCLYFTGNNDQLGSKECDHRYVRDIPWTLQKSVDKITSTKDFILLQGSTKHMIAFAPDGRKIKDFFLYNGWETFGTVFTGPDYIVMGPDYSKGSSTNVYASIFDRKKKSFGTLLKQSLSDLSAYTLRVSGQKYSESGTKFISDQGNEKIKDDFRLISANPIVISGRGLATQDVTKVTPRHKASQLDMFERGNKDITRKTITKNTGYRPVMIDLFRGSSDLIGKLRMISLPTSPRYSYFGPLVLEKTDITSSWTNKNNYIGWTHVYKSAFMPEDYIINKFRYQSNCYFFTYDGATWKKNLFQLQVRRINTPIIALVLIHSQMIFYTPQQVRVVASSTTIIPQ